MMNINDKMLDHQNYYFKKILNHFVTQLFCLWKQHAN